MPNTSPKAKRPHDNHDANDDLSANTSSASVHAELIEAADAAADVMTDELIANYGVGNMPDQFENVAEMKETLDRLVDAIAKAKHPNRLSPIVRLK